MNQYIYWVILNLFQDLTEWLSLNIRASIILMCHTNPVYKRIASLSEVGQKYR